MTPRETYSDPTPEEPAREPNFLFLLLFWLVVGTLGAVFLLLQFLFTRKAK
jgi:hypothetical protein